MWDLVRPLTLSPLLHSRADKESVTLCRQIMYTGGVSGSCWALGGPLASLSLDLPLVDFLRTLSAYYTWGEFSTKRVLAHFAKHSMQYVAASLAL